MPTTTDATSEHLKIEGPFDLSTATEICNTLRETLSREPEVVADLSGIATCDAAAIQVLFAAKRTATLAKKRFFVAEPLPEVLVTAGTVLGLELDDLGESRCADAI